MRLWYLVISFLVYGCIVASDGVHAASHTSSDTSPGQVRTRSQEDGTMYLTTEVNPAETTQAPQSTSQASVNRQPSEVTGETVQRQRGYADNLGAYLNSALGFVIIISLLLAFLNFIQAGIQWITSGGDKSKTEEARNKIVHSFIGILIVSASFALVGFVAYVLGFESINDALDDVRRINPS